LITQISIHSPHTGRDRLVNAPIVSPSLFQSTLPAWGETRVDSNGQKRKIRISIHSPRMGRDMRYWTSTGGWNNFNPLSPHGERRDSLDTSLTDGIFQSTLPAWGETTGERAAAFARSFQSTLPAWGETTH